MPKILLVEDNEMNRDMLSRRLQRKGYEVVLAVDGQSGVEMAQTEAPDLVLMDMSLPVLDGWEATRRLKADADRHSTFPSSPSPRTPCPATAKKPSKPAATTTTPSRSNCRVCSAKIEALLGRRGGKMASAAKASIVTEPEHLTSEAARHALPPRLIHDLRTPLNQIIGYSEMLIEQAQEQGQRGLRAGSAEDACCRQATAGAHPRQLSTRPLA